MNEITVNRKQQNQKLYSDNYDLIFKTKKEKFMDFPSTHKTFKMGDKVKKTKGSEWKGTVVGWYSTTLTPEGYAVESSTEKGSKENLRKSDIFRLIS
jgi:hypothetical protein